MLGHTVGWRAGSSRYDQYQYNLQSDAYQDLCEPIASHGEMWSFTNIGLVIDRDNVYSRPSREVIAWDSFSKCDVEWHCFSASLHLRHKGSGQTIHIQGFASWHSSSRVQAAAKVCREHMHGFFNDGEMDPELPKSIKGKTTILPHGLIWEKHKMCGWSGFSRFVPWESIVTLKMSTRHARSTILLNSHMGHTSRGLYGQHYQNDAEINGKASHEALHMDSEMLQLYGRKRLDNVFKFIQKKITGPHRLAKVKYNPADMKHATLLERGVVVKQPAGCFGVEVEHFFPWDAISSLEWKHTFCAAATIVITDSLGHRVPIPKTTKEQLHAMERVLADAHVTSFHGTEGSVDLKVHRRNHIVLMKDGVSVENRLMCSQHVSFYPWYQIEGVEINLFCCGGNIELLTDRSKRIVLWSSMFSHSALFEIWRKIRKLKYGVDFHRDHADDIYFAGKPHSRYACKLSRDFLRLATKTGTCSHTVRIIDLPAITHCSVQKDTGCCPARYLVITVDRGVAESLRHEDNSRKREAKNTKDNKGRALPGQIVGNDNSVVARLATGDDAEVICMKIETRKRGVRVI